MRASRPWYELDEIERICESSLRAAGLWPARGYVRVDIERFVELHVGAVVDYGVDLDRETLGYTILGDPPRVVVNRKLTELAQAPGASLGLRGRWRATLAHEAAHLLLHASLFSSQTPRQHADGAGDENDARSPRDWREVQANMGMAALLMPRRPFLASARDVLEASTDGSFLPIDSRSPPALKLVSELAEAFETSLQATRLRLTVFGVLTGEHGS